MNYKVFDCITFFDENLLTNARFEILNDVVDYFVICESNFDHKGNKKKINFELKNLKFKNKIRHIIINNNFPKPTDGWKVEELQREEIIKGLKDAENDDYIMYSDSDEIPNPKVIKNIELVEKFGIFLQNFYVYKLNIFNQYETPWEGTRITKKKYLKSITHLRKKIRSKNLSKPFWKLNNEKSIQLFNNGGWHFNNLYEPEQISKKLKTFQHLEFSSDKYSSVNIIKSKIKNLEDLFGRNHKYKKIELNSEDYPEYIISNINLFKNYIY